MNVPPEQWPLEVRNIFGLIRKVLHFSYTGADYALHLESHLRRADFWRPCDKLSALPVGETFLLRSAVTGEVFQVSLDWENDGTWEQPQKDFLSLYNHTKAEVVDDFDPEKWLWREQTKEEKQNDRISE